MLDHDGAGLAGIARELAFLDAQGGRPQGFAGARGDRNVRLFVPVAPMSEVRPARGVLRRGGRPALRRAAALRADRSRRRCRPTGRSSTRAASRRSPAALAVLHPRTRAAAGWWLTATLVAVFPANVNMALHAERFAPIPAPLLWLRLPLQAPLVAWVRRATSRR